MNFKQLASARKIALGIAIACAGTSEGAKKAWESRRKGGRGKAAQAPERRAAAKKIREVRAKGRAMGLKQRGINAGARNAGADAYYKKSGKANEKQALYTRR